MFMIFNDVVFLVMIIAMFQWRTTAHHHANDRNDNDVMNCGNNDGVANRENDCSSRTERAFREEKKEP
ncbi:hypothetical protein ACSQ67_000268 [Phaseolus vulgaris]